jgi:hypothetical protein
VFLSASALGFLELEIVTRLVLMVAVMLVLALIGRVVILLVNLPRSS